MTIETTAPATFIERYAPQRMQIDDQTIQLDYESFYFCHLNSQAAHVCTYIDHLTDIAIAQELHERNSYHRRHIDQSAHVRDYYPFE